jgi:uncharacterized protein (TIGR02117 family)
MYFFIRLFFIISLSVLTSCSSVTSKPDSAFLETSHTIYFIYRSWHTSLLIDATTLAGLSQHLKQDAQDQEYIRVGWGDGDYFTGKNKTRWSATKALFISGYSALQVLPYEDSPFIDELTAGTWVPLRISEKGMQHLVKYIDASLALDEDKKTIPLKAYASNTGSFYQANKHYSLLTNCNTWSGKALQAAGLPIKSTLRLTAKSVFAQAKAISEAQQSQREQIGYIGTILTPN